MMYCSDKFFLFPGQQLASHIFFPGIGQTKVNNFQGKGFFLQKQKVFRLQVPMGNILRVAIFYSIENLFKNFSSISFTKTTLLRKPIKQLSPITIASLTNNSTRWQRSNSYYLQKSHRFWWCWGDPFSLRYWFHWKKKQAGE